MSRREKLGWFLIIAPCVAGMALGGIFLGSTFAKVIGIVAAIIASIMTGCTLLEKS